jgi:dolichyl-phosphate beta-glucosyltransferase
MDISIVIPALNESTKIAFDVEMAAAFMEGNNFQGEIIVVDDGSTDGTSKVAKGVKVPQSITLKVIRNEQHCGKGYAVRAGIKETSGEYVMFADSGYCVPYGNALRGLEMLKGGTCDIAHGSRKLIESNIQRNQPWRRRISSAVFKWLIKKFMQIPAGLTDTQCGFKIYKGNVARELYSQCISDGFMFDIEIILRAQKQGYRIKEFPIEWTCDIDSRLKLSRTPWLVFSELRTIKRALSDSKIPRTKM